MAEKADYVVAYVNSDWGGAYKTFEYAKKSNKKIFNLAETPEENFDWICKSGHIRMYPIKQSGAAERAKNFQPSGFACNYFAEMLHYIRTE